MTTPTFRALILAAGMGTRMGSVTRERPKALIEIGGESLLRRVIRQCVSAGIVDIHIVVGYRGEEIRAAVAAMDLPISATFVESPDFEKSNNIVSLQKGFGHVVAIDPTAHLILIECDVVLDDSVIQGLVKGDHANVAVVSPFQLGMDGTVVRLVDGLVKELITTAHQGPDFEFDGTFKTVNVYRLSPELWVAKLPKLLEWYVDQVGVMSYYEHAIGMFAYASGGDLHGLTIDWPLWHEIDDQNDLRVASYRFSESDQLAVLTGSHGGWWDFPVLDFNYLRNVHFPPPALLAQLRQQLELALHNYGSSQVILDEKMSWLLDSEASKTLALAGLASLYPSMTDLLDDPSVLIPTPSFGEYLDRYPRATTYDASLPLGSVESLLERADARALVVVNSNNPTGTLHRSRDLLELARRYPTVLFVIDESFLPFTEEPSIRTICADEDTNVVVLASLSKSFGVPGLRIGYAWSHDVELMTRLRSALPIWAMNSLSEIFLGLAMKFKREYRESLEQTALDKAAFIDALSSVPGIEVAPEVHGDFCLVSMPGLPDASSDRVSEAMLHRGILIKDVGPKLGLGHPVFRIAVRSAEDNRIFVQQLHEVMLTMGAR